MLTLPAGGSALARVAVTVRPPGDEAALRAASPGPAARWAKSHWETGGRSGRGAFGVAVTVAWTSSIEAGSSANHGTSALQWNGASPRVRMRRPSSNGAMYAVSRADRKSTRLNSSHQIISYAVFSFKKKTRHYTPF